MSAADKLHNLRAIAADHHAIGENIGSRFNVPDDKRENTLDSYAEISVSGTGVHVIAKGFVPPGGNRRSCIELYSHGRFFVMTGNRIADTPRTIEQRADHAVAIHTQHVARPEPRSITATASVPNDTKALGRIVHEHL